MTNLLQDFRYAVRQLRRAPGFTMTAVLTLALGVGANSAIFSLLDQALLRSLPVRSPKQLVILQGTGKMWQGRTSGHGGDVQLLFSYPMYRDLRDHAPALQGLVATTSVPVGIQQGDTSSAEDAEFVSANYFNVLGVQPLLGRVLNDADDRAPGASPVAVLSYEYWHDHLGADNRIVGRTLRLNGQSWTVVGVAAPGFRSAVWGQTPALFVPLSATPLLIPSQKDGLRNRQDRWLNLVGRLRDGTGATTAEAQIAPLWHALRAQELQALGNRSERFTDEFLANSRLHLLPGAQGLSYSRETLETPLLVIAGMAALVLLIASVNVASLLLVRSAGRVREFALRYAMGATARRVVSQLLLEGMLIGLASAALGAAVAPLAVHALSARLTDPGDPAFFPSGVDARVLVFSLAVGLATSVLFSIGPSVMLLKPDLVASLKQQGGTAGKTRIRFRRLVVGLQVGLSVVLLIGAGLLVRTLQSLRRVDVGFNTAHLLQFRISPELAGYTPQQIAPLQLAMLDRLASLPGVQSVAATDSAELAGSDNGTNVTVEGYTAPPDEDLDIGRIEVTPGYFSTLREPIVAGRDFSETDNAANLPVAIVNQSFARHYFGSDAAALNRRMARGGGKNPQWMQIVGVSRDAHHIGLRDGVKMTDFTPLAQDSKAGRVTVYLRTVQDPLSLQAAVTATMRQISLALAVQNMRTMKEQIDNTLRDEKIVGLLAIAFGVLATLLAGIGLYGVLAFSVAQRTREIGIRMALGSTRALVARMVVFDVLQLAGVGIAVALPLALLAARSLRGQLYGVSATDPVTIAEAVVLITTVALLAGLIPARRAATIHPTTALRTE
ncbi:ABC transporter permease [Terriglobus sp.]|uniref:ABC transporter permease n=1 Tax=Terriglobus sp. TaxID=1889013 RepID=UPI003B00F48E